MNRTLTRPDLEDLLCQILAATFDSNRTETHEGEDGHDYSLVVHDTSEGIIKATVYRHTDMPYWREDEVAEVRLDYKVKAVTPPVTADDADVLRSILENANPDHMAPAESALLRRLIAAAEAVAR